MLLNLKAFATRRGAVAALSAPLLVSLGALIPAQAGATGRVVTAKVVALDQPYVYNRFGSHNPYGMVYALERDVVDKTTGKTLDQPGASASACNVELKAGKRPRPLVLRANLGDRLEIRFTNLLCATAPGGEPVAEPEGGLGTNRPKTRLASMMFNGLTYDTATNNWDPRNTGISGIAPGQSITYKLTLDREGGHLFFDNAAPAGGEGDGGSMVLGLYGSVNVQPTGAKSYRSQVPASHMAAARAQAMPGTFINYEAVDTDGSLTGSAGTPILNMHRETSPGVLEVVHSDLNAVVQDFAFAPPTYAPDSAGFFREFTVIFQDELKTVQAYADAIDPEGVGHGIRDGFGINYGASGAGSIIAANRLGEGPAKTCIACAYEDFFLTSWANGDPAMVVKPNESNQLEALYPDDPGNVHHSYMGDRVVFRNMQAGVKETHVFHLHAHQWFGAKDATNATYLDSQTLSPLQSMNYSIAYGGSGNRNGTVGDSIFHCHLYPHFAQGMWALWRVHDVFEDGARMLPDGELGPGTDPMTGATTGGAPSPGLVPMKGNAMAPMPTYGANGMPGYPFYVAGRAGFRPPQAPLDIREDSSGLGRHVVKGGMRTVGAGLQSGDMSVALTSADIELLPPDGTLLERQAMTFHALTGVSSTKPEGGSATFRLNGKAPAAGAPFADPCPAEAPIRTYEVSAVELNLVVNKQGWHDPQARINVLTSQVDQYEGQKRAADPFFFRAASGECVVFYHQNRLPHELKLDDFQVRTPTDVLGQHIHLVKFDVTASDGSGNGWNYEDGTLARDALRERVHAARTFGTVTKVNGDGTQQSLSATVTLPLPDTVGFQTTTQRWWVDPLLNPAGKDRTLRTVFTHDHFGPSSIQQHGFYAALTVEPEGSAWTDEKGNALPGGGVGPQAIIKNAFDQETHPHHREFMLAVADFATIYRDDGTPVDPPPKPEAISAEHHNPYLVNYKMEAIPLRLSSSGSVSTLHTDARGENANIFNSSVHGDPFTPVFRAYEGDSVTFRMIQGAQEVQHVFNMHGLRWKREISMPASPYVAAQEIGISEHFEMDVGKLPPVAGLPNSSDYLWHYGTSDALWNGAWGLLRTYATPTTLDAAKGVQAASLIATLPNNPNGRGIISMAGFKADGCPLTAPVKTFNVQVWAARDLLPGGKLVYNARAGITDPTALMYVHAGDVAALQAGTKKPEPLVLRANAGDCIKVTLTNKLPAGQDVPDLPGDALMPTITSLNVDDLKPSKQVGIHAQLVNYDVRNSDGANVGYNPTQTVGPNGSRTYTWYAGTVTVGANGVRTATPREFGTVALRAYGDVVKHGAQGLVGALVIEPQGSTYWNASNTAMMVGGTDATIRYSNGTKVREFVVVYQDGLNLRVGANAEAIAQHFVGDDSYDLGERAFNYRAEPLWSRIDYSAQGGSPACSSAASVMSQDINPCELGANLMVDDDARIPAEVRGLPIETPIFNAKTGDKIRFRVLQADGRARQHTFRVLGHNYADLGISNYIAPGNSLIAPGKAITGDLDGGAKKGYWIYRDGPNMFVNTGLWGVMKVDD